MRCFLAGRVYIEVCLRHPLTHQRLYVVSRVGGSADARPQASAFRVIFALFDSKSHDPGGVEVEEHITEVELCEFGDA